MFEGFNKKYDDLIVRDIIKNPSYSRNSKQHTSEIEKKILQEILELTQLLSQQDNELKKLLSQQENDIKKIAQSIKNTSDERKNFQKNDEPKKNITNDMRMKILCNYGTMCKNKVCPYKHPATCHYGNRCTNVNCKYSHPPNCKFGNKCIKKDCPYRHPPECKFGEYCKNRSCGFLHKEHNEKIKSIDAPNLNSHVEK